MRALDSLPEDLGLTQQGTSVVTAAPGGLALPASVGTRHVQDTHTYLQAHTYT